MRKLIASLVVLCSTGAVLANPLADALARNDGTLCFIRTYDSEWRLSDMRFVLDLPRGPLYGFGQCWWETNINRGVQNDILDPTFKPTKGVYCHMMTDITGGSAEEGAEFSVDWQSDGRTIQAHLAEAMAMWTSYDISGTADWHQLKAADRIVRLHRAGASACATLINNFAPNGLE